MTADEATARLRDQPLGAEIAYVPAKIGKAPGFVVNQDPRRGGLSANDDVQLWVSKAQYGQLANLVGSSVVDVNRELKRLRLRAKAVTAPGRAGIVLRQYPRPGVAVRPGLTVRLVVGDGSGR
jgi:beta-lactam-binding protein with PASTA domain